MEIISMTPDSEALTKIREYNDSNIAEIEFKTGANRIDLTEEVKKTIPALKSHEFSIDLIQDKFRLLVYPANTRVAFESSRMQYVGDETENGLIIDNIGYEQGVLYIEVKMFSEEFSPIDFEEIKLRTR